MKEPVPSEFRLFKKHLAVFCYLHTETRPDLVDALLERQVTGIAFENIRLADDNLFTARVQNARGHSQRYQAGDRIGILGQSSGWFIYLRNLYFIYRKPGVAPGAGEDPGPEAELGDG